MLDYFELLINDWILLLSFVLLLVVVIIVIFSIFSYIKKSMSCGVFKYNPQNLFSTFWLDYSFSPNQIKLQVLGQYIYHSLLFIIKKKNKKKIQGKAYPNDPDEKPYKVIIKRGNSNYTYLSINQYCCKVTLILTEIEYQDFFKNLNKNDSIDISTEQMPPRMINKKNPF